MILNWQLCQMEPWSVLVMKTIIVKLPIRPVCIKNGIWFVLYGTWSIDIYSINIYSDYPKVKTLVLSEGVDWNE